MAFMATCFQSLFQLWLCSDANNQYSDNHNYSIYWNDKLSIKHLNNLSHYEREKFSTFPENPSTRSYVVELRNKLREFFFTHGAVHVQIVNFYNFRESLDDNYINFLSLIKNTLDPNIILNPGKLDSIGIEDK